ncbi:hypothetical protein B0T24DRAFT_634480 [Lasiosphaeria ovina]|uniref:Uncharacterized protein n=1 Tax=Lasiosphaeria ovina TaxID=92902 RepID=A0AAE0N193_9PEZI|nr:hypothetical protein B0T24DRAFT_634480 [Lasiosphaeria ovina]
MKESGQKLYTGRRLGKHMCFKWREKKHCANTTVGNWGKEWDLKVRKGAISTRNEKHFSKGWLSVASLSRFLIPFSYLFFFSFSFHFIPLLSPFSSTYSVVLVYRIVS